MKIAVVGDVHVISDHDPYKNLHVRRAFFKSCWPSFQHLLKKVNDEAPDLVILLGDLVDWFSHENMVFGLDLLADLHSPWYMTPGNHDIAVPTVGYAQNMYQTEATRDYLSNWSKQGVDLSTRVIELDGCHVILLDSAMSNLNEGDEVFLAQVLENAKMPLLFTHVPVDLPETRDYILSVDSRRNMSKYVLSGSPNLYPHHIKGRIPHVFSGHLHFAGNLECDATRFHLCNMGITMYDPHRDQSAIAQATLIEGQPNALSFRQITVV